MHCTLVGRHFVIVISSSEGGGGYIHPWPRGRGVRTQGPAPGPSNVPLETWRLMDHHVPAMEIISDAFVLVGGGEGALRR